MSSPSKADTPLTISTLLSSLHSHLQTQTELLPTLHQQLGLPQSALSDELSALQQRLTHCVENQIEARREEVETWMKKCDGIERCCLKYNKALGGHIKAISASVGELRKQQVLPVRHEMLVQYQDKLDQLYRTKLEQLANLRSRITSLSRTLGSTFFGTEILEELSINFEVSPDTESLKDVTPERFSKLEKELVRGKGEITRRLTHLSTTMLQIDWLCTELGVAPPTCDETEYPSSSDVNGMKRTNLTPTLNAQLDPFMCSASSMSTPTPASRTKGSSVNLFTDEECISDYRRVYSLFIMRIDEAEAEGRSLEPGSIIGLEGIEPTLGLVSWTEKTKRELEEIKKRRETQIQSMYDQLELLWKRLGVEDDDIDEFVDNNKGSTEANVLAYEQELERMLELKRERMSVFIYNARTEIEALWNDLMVGAEEKADFAPFADDEHTEELLMIHETEIRRLKEERRLKAPLLANIRKYFEICEEEKELATASQDQSRLLGRGPRDPGRLLREEKMRKRVNREKPRLEQELLLIIPAWEEDNGKRFMVNGESIIEILQETISAADKENAKKKPRAGSVPPRSTTPLSSSTSRGTHSNNVTPAVRTGSTMVNSAPAKRQKLASSTSSNSGRAPFATRSGSVNGASSDNEMPSTVHKSGKTPMTSLPRPRSVSRNLHSVQPPPPVPQLPHGRAASMHGHKIGRGHASTASKNRSVSASNVRSTTYTTPSYTTSSSASIGLGHPPRRPARNSRRESFKPRPSVDDTRPWIPTDAGARYGGGFASSVREEDEYC